MKLTITLEDTGVSRVRVKVNPNLERIVADKIKRNEPMTPAENYAMLMCHAVREASKKLDNLESKRIITPGEF